MEFLTSKTSQKKTRVKKSPSYKVDWDKASRSKFQKKVKDFLKPYWKYDAVYEEFPMAGSRLRFDFYNHNRKIVIEVQGRQHFQYVKHFHGNRGSYVDHQQRDWNKLEFCNLNGIVLIEILSEDEINEDFFAEHGII